MRTDFATLARWSEIMECRRLRVRCATAPPRLRKATGKLSNERAVEHQYPARLCPLARSIDRHTLTVRRTLVLQYFHVCGKRGDRKSGPEPLPEKWPLIKESRGNVTYADHRHSLGEASGRSPRTIIHVRVQGISESGRSGGQRRLPVQRVGCVLSRRTRHNGSCLTDSKDDAVQREGGTVVVETQRMRKSRSTSTPAPLLRWIFRRGDRALTCQLERETGHSYAVSLVAHWDVTCAAIE